MRGRLLLVPLLAIVACAGGSAPPAAPASPAAGTSASTSATAAPTAGLEGDRGPELDGEGGGEDPIEDPAEAIPAYDRGEWKHWVDADGDCQDARQEVLIAESEIAVTFESSKRCRVATGRWTCPFTGEVFTDPGKLDVDHLVPLAETHDSGAWKWGGERREAYANDLNAPEHLVAVNASANRSKGAKDPAKWLPRSSPPGVSTSPTGPR